VNESLSLAIRHHTGFTYDGIAKSSYNEARMTPISGASQEVRNAHIAVQPVVPLSTHTDYFGTVVTASTSKSRTRNWRSRRGRTSRVAPG